MKNYKLFLPFVLILLNSISIFGQREIKGRVIDDNFDYVIQARVYDKNMVLLGNSDLNGYFKINIPSKTDTLIFGYIGYELATIKFSSNCNYFEVILFPAATYDFMTSRKIDRLRKKEFNKIPALHKQAKQKDIFLNDTICYERKFQPIKHELDDLKKKYKKNKQKNLK